MEQSNGVCSFLRKVRVGTFSVCHVCLSVTMRVFTMDQREVVCHIPDSLGETREVRQCHSIEKSLS